MKTPVRFLFILPFFSFLFISTIHSQAYLDGPSQLCYGECATYTIVDPNGWTPKLLSWTINGVDVNNFSPWGPEYTICADQPDDLLIEMAGLLLYVLGQIGFDIEKSISVIALPAPIITSTSQCLDSLSSCDQICAFQTATYEVTNVPAGADVEWQVLGAENVIDNGHSVEVDWGAPGQGEVTAIMSEANVGGNPMQIFGGRAGEPVSQIVAGFVKIIGGVAPYEIEVTEPSGDLTIFIDNGGHVEFPVTEDGQFLVKVTDATGEVAYHDFFISFINISCWVTGYPEIVEYPTGCDDCNGIVYIVYHGGGAFNTLFSFDGGATFTPEPFAVNLCPGDYSIVIQSDGVPQDCTTEFMFTLPCSDASPVTCLTESSLCVEILEDPKANIAAAPPVINDEIEICQGQTVFFQNASENATSYAWDFGDLNTSALFEPSHTYQTPGSYTVSMVARNSCYCSDTSFVTVNVLPAEVPDILCTGTVCEGETVTYSTEANCSQFQWTISNGGTVLDGGGTDDNFVTVEWQSGPQGAVSLVVDGCAGNVCQTANVVPIPIISETAEIQGRTNVCEGSTEEYSIPDYHGTQITWSVEGSGNIMEGQGTERVTVNWFGDASQGNPQRVIVSFDNCYLGCEGRDTLEVNIVPSFYTKGPIEVCEKSFVDYVAFNSITNGPVLCDWEVIDENDITVWSADGMDVAGVDWNLPIGTYTVRAKPMNTNNFCNNIYDIFVDIVAAPAPVSNINGAVEICPDETYSYQADGLPINEFNWTVTGGTPSYFKGNPFNVTWGATPPYEISVTQTATLGLACTSDPISLTINTIQPLSINGASQICMEETTTYSAPFFENVHYEWVISPAENGTIINGQGTEQVEVLWHKDGAAMLNVSACGMTETINVQVLPPPTPQVIHPNEICAGELVLVQTSQTYNSYNWLDENGLPVSNLPNPNLPAGHYELKVTDQNGCQGQTAFDITELPSPSVSVTIPTYRGICEGGVPLTITASTTNDGYDYQWFANTVPSPINSPFLLVNTSGFYEVIVTDQNGCTAQASTTLQDCEEVGGICINGLCTSPVCNNPNSCILDGAISFDILKTSDCFTHQYINTSTNDIPNSWNWDFGDPASGTDNASSLENPTHTFSGVGYYGVILTGQIQEAGTNGACPDGILIQDTILAAADFSFELACPGAPVQFTDLSEILPFASITSWTWDFGDPTSGTANTSTDQHPTHVYPTTGTYTVTLTITEADGCSSAVSQDVTIFDPPSVNFALSPITCENTAIPFSAIVSDDAISMEWDFGDPSSGSANTATQMDTHHEYTAAGTYSVTLTATNIFGCSASFTENITITTNPLGGDITYSQPPPICEGDNIILTAPTGGVTYEWSVPSTADQITVSTAGIYDVTLTDSEGCIYSPDDAPIDIYGNPNGIIQAVEYNEYGQPLAFFNNNYETCEREDVHLIINGSLDYSYEWSGGNGMGEEISFTEERDDLLTVGTYNFTVTVTDNTTSCTSEEGPFTVTVHPKPPVQIVSDPSGFLCENNSADLNVVSPNANLNYQWNTGEMGHSITIVAGGTYFVQATNQFGCKNRSNEITLNNAPDIDKIPTGCHTRCGPDTLCLPDLPLVTSFQWLHNGAPMPAPNGTMAEPIFEQSGEYSVIMTDIYGCKSKSDVLTLDVVPGFGDVLGNVYFDVNENGVIDAGDTLVSGIDIFINNGAANIDTTTSEMDGYIFPNILSTNYTVELDTNSLPTGWQTYFTTGQIELTGCDVEEPFDWLVYFQCTPQTATENLQACQGGGITFDGQYIEAGAVDTFSYLTFQGCDSFVVVSVAALPPDTLQEQLSVCMGQTIGYEGVDLSPGDAQVFTLSDGNGCDSIVHVSVIGIAPDTSQAQFDICMGQTVAYEGVDLAPGEQQFFNLSTVDGCDSIVHVSVIGIAPDTSQAQFDICMGQTVAYEGVDLAPGEQQFFNLSTINGCDSIVHVSVIGIAPDTIQEQLNTCENTTIGYQGTQLAPGDQQTFTLSSFNGCDSLVHVSVGAWPVYEMDLPLSVCENASIDYNGQTLFPGDEETFLLNTINGCDSMISVTVSPIEGDTTQQPLFACPNGSVTYEGIDFIPGDAQDFTFVAVGGCDSVVQISVAPLPTFAMNLPMLACENNSVEYNGQTLFSGQQQDFILTAMNGCDSIVTVIVDAILTDTTQEQLNACPNTTATYQGVDLAPGEEQFFTFQAANGCDSVVQVSVGELPTYSMNLPLSACENASIEYNGETFFPGDQQDVILTAENGCDSVISVSVAPLPVDTTALPLQVCTGELIDFNGQQLSEGEQLQLLLTNQSGCDSLIEVNVAAYPSATFELMTNEICDDATNGEITVQNIQGSSAPYQISLDGLNYQSAMTFDALSAGSHVIYLLDGNDCQHEQPIEIPTVPPMLIQANDETMVCGDEVLLSPTVISPLPTTWQWNDGSTSPSLSITSPGSYGFTVSNDCESINANISVTLEPTGLGSVIFMPNSFSPNGDGINDCYQGYLKSNVEVESFVLKIFDRWGDMMHEATDPTTCWDGRQKGQMMQPAVFVWFVKMEVRNCDGQVLELFEEGGIHLMR